MRAEPLQKIEDRTVSLSAHRYMREMDKQKISSIPLHTTQDTRKGFGYYFGITLCIIGFLGMFLGVGGWLAELVVK